MVKFAEYIWIDGTDPTPLLRSKTKILKNDEDPPVWGFDGSSTNQATGNDSDCVLKPVHVSPDPFRGAQGVLVLCEVRTPSGAVHNTNNRHACLKAAMKHEDADFWFGLEQEYTLMLDGKPLGFPEDGEPQPQGDYYCSAGANRAFGRRIADQHMVACIMAGINVSGINAEVCPGQWEFQIGPSPAIDVADEVWLARYIMERVAENHEVDVSWSGKPMIGDWNGAGCHTNFSTKKMRESYDACIQAAEALGKNTEQHINNYGHGIKERLTGAHETCAHNEFKYGVADRTASVRIPGQVYKDKKGYIEDRRPNANCDPYIVTKLIMDTVCLYGDKD